MGLSDCNPPRSRSFHSRERPHDRSDHYDRTHRIPGVITVVPLSIPSVTREKRVTRGLSSLSTSTVSRHYFHDFHSTGEAKRYGVPFSYVPSYPSRSLRHVTRQKREKRDGECDGGWMSDSE